MQARYAAISSHLERNRRKFAVEFRYLEEGIRIKGNWFPVLKMRWVEGFTLNEDENDWYQWSGLKYFRLLSRDHKSSEQFTCFNRRYHEMKAE